MVNATLMNIADNPTNVQLPGARGFFSTHVFVCWAGPGCACFPQPVPLPTVPFPLWAAGVYKNEEIPRVPIVCTGNDFSTLYAPLIRDGRMEKYYWK